jgi:hypothetical protein
MRGMADKRRFTVQQESQSHFFLYGNKKCCGNAQYVLCLFWCAVEPSSIIVRRHQQFEDGTVLEKIRGWGAHVHNQQRLRCESSHAKELEEISRKSTVELRDVRAICAVNLA